MAKCYVIAGLGMAQKQHRFSPSWGPKATTAWARWRAKFAHPPVRTLRDMSSEEIADLERRHGARVLPRRKREGVDDDGAAT